MEVAEAMDVRDEDIEFIPTDDLIEHDEPGGADEAAVSVEVPDQPRQRMTVEDEDFEADEMEEDEADEEPIAEAARAVGEAEKIEVLEEAEEEEHESDLEEILRRHAGLEEEPEETEAAAPDQRVVQTPPVREFVCAGCFLRRPISQLADPAGGLCADCAASS